MKKPLFALTIAAGVSGCAAQSGIVPIGPDSYLVSHRDGVAGRQARYVNRLEGRSGTLWE